MLRFSYLKKDVKGTTCKTLVQIVIATIFLSLSSCALLDNKAQFDVLVFHKTEGFRHSSIPTAVDAIEDIGRDNDFTVYSTNDGAIFSTQSLNRYEVIIFLNTTGNFLNDNQQNVFENYIRNGGGFVGIHAASDAEYDWEWYGNLVGAYFRSHPHVQQAEIIIEDDTHPSTNHLQSPWILTDEWYNFQSNPRSNVHVVAALDEASYTGGDMGDHPIVWYHDYEGGRAWYTGLGHSEGLYVDPQFVDHLLGGIFWATGL
jgi:type 1 glutamine amidotransferase